MRALEGNRDARRVLAGAAATSLGEWGLFVTLGLYAYAEGGATLVGVAALVQAVAAIVAAPAVTVLLDDRVSRRRVLLVANAGRAGVVAAMGLAVAVGAPVWSVMVLAAAHGGVSTANQPVRAALIWLLARSPDEAWAANALLSSVNNAGFLVGSGGGGLLVAATDPQTGFAWCAVAYLAGVALIATVPADAPGAVHGGIGWRGPAALAAALRIVAASSPLRSVFVLVAVLSVADGMIGVLVFVAPIQLLDMGASGPGVLNIACGVGGLATGAVGLALARRSELSTVVLSGSLALGVPLALCALVAQPVAAILAWCCVGLGYSLVKSASLTLVARAAPDHSLLRVLVALESVFVAGLGLGSVVAPLLVALTGVRGTLVVTALMLPIVALARRGALRVGEESPASADLLPADPILTPPHAIDPAAREPVRGGGPRA